MHVDSRCCIGRLPYPTLRRLCEEIPPCWSRSSAPRGSLKNREYVQSPAHVVRSRTIRWTAANAVNVPVFLSIMTQVPFIQQSLGSNKKLCIVCAAEFTMNARVFEQCGITTTSNLTICGMRGCSEFDRMLEGQDPINPRKLRDEVLTICTKATRQDDAIAAFLLQCSDLPPFGPDIQSATGLPVFDMTLLIRWLQSASDYLPYSGICRRRPLPSIKS